jgi:hypothetical protein
MDSRLDWVIQNERHWYMASCGQDEHLIIMHNAYGPSFPWHFANADVLVVEADMVHESKWGCHYLARWWSGKTDFWACEIYTGEPGFASMHFHTRHQDNVVTLSTTPSAAFFLTRLMKVRTPKVHVRWLGKERKE